MSRRQRQLDELRALCCSGSLGRAVDLAFLHFADFGRSNDVLDLLAGALDATGASPAVCCRFAELAAEVPSAHAHRAARPARGAR